MGIWAEGDTKSLPPRVCSNRQDLAGIMTERLYILLLHVLRTFKQGADVPRYALVLRGVLTS